MSQRAGFHLGVVHLGSGPFACTKGTKAFENFLQFRHNRVAIEKDRQKDRKKIKITHVLDGQANFS